MSFRQNADEFELPESGNIAVFSDLHGNAEALEAAIEQLHRLNASQAVDVLVLLGDLYT